MNSNIQAKFSYSNPAQVVAPDEFDMSDKISDNFVISRENNGEVLSVYGDDTWDLLPYSRISLSSSHISFKSWVPLGQDKLSLAEQLIDQLKKIVFCEIYLSSQSFATTTLVGRYTLWAKLAKNLFLQGKCFATANDKDHMQFIQHELRKNSSFAQNIIPRIRFAQNCFPNKVAEFSFLSKYAYGVFERAANQSLKLYKNSQSKQTTVVPSRIYSELIIKTDTFITDFNTHSANLFAFLTACSHNRAYGRALSRQMYAIKKMDTLGTYNRDYEIPRDSRGFIWWQKFDDFEPEFAEAANEFNLTTYFNKYNVNGFSCLQRLLGDLQRAAVINIALFTGAREGEIAHLPMDCISTVVLDKQEHVLISGFSSKMQQRITDSEWVADTSTKDAVEAVSSLAKYVLKVNEIEYEESATPLFLKLDGIGCIHGGQKLASKKPNSPVYSLPISPIVKTAQKFLGRFPSEFEIKEADIAEVVDVDPHYGYMENINFNVGQSWPLSDHQLRRSLVAYAFNDGVDHPDLKWQLKHISLSMTLWYGRSGAFAKAITKSSDHVYKDYQDAIVEYEASQYLANVISEDVKLHGTHGVFISNMIVKHGYDETRRLVSRGELAYKETPIGGCVSLSGCSMDAFINITSCIPCKNSVFTTEDVPKIEKAIVHIENIVSFSDENSQAYISSKLQITELNRLRNKVINND